jgi:hypothetical protein
MRAEGISGGPRAASGSGIFLAVPIMTSVWLISHISSYVVLRRSPSNWSGWRSTLPRRAKPSRINWTSISARPTALGVCSRRSASSAGRGISPQIRSNTLPAPSSPS